MYIRDSFTNVQKLKKFDYLVFTIWRQRK